MSAIWFIVALTRLKPAVIKIQGTVSNQFTNQVNLHRNTSKFDRCLSITYLYNYNRIIFAIAPAKLVHRPNIGLKDARKSILNLWSRVAISEEARQREKKRANELGMASKVKTQGRGSKY